MSNTTTVTQQAQPFRANPLVHRGCGPARTLGGVYLEFNFDAREQALEQFLVDPCTRLPKTSSLGVHHAPRKGVTHLIDVVGEKYYPYPSDIIEEIRQHGLSRKVSVASIEGYVTPESRMILAHPKAVVSNAKALVPYLEDRPLKLRCVQYILGQSVNQHHLLESCTRLSYALAEGHEDTSVPHIRLRHFTKDTVYPVVPLLPGHPAPKYGLGKVGVFPITHISVVSSGSREDKELVRRLKERIIGIPVTESSR